MKKRIVLTAVVIGVVSEIAAIIYTQHMREEIVYGGEYFVLPLFIIAAYIMLEIFTWCENRVNTKCRLTRRTKSGKAILSTKAFPEYAEEALIREVNAFNPFTDVVERLCTYEESENVYE
jgi:hypothetical protein